MAWTGILNKLGARAGTIGNIGTTVVFGAMAYNRNKQSERKITEIQRYLQKIQTEQKVVVDGQNIIIADRRENQELFEKTFKTVTEIHELVRKPI